MLLRSARQKLHERIARMLERDRSEIIESQPELLARHCAEAGLECRLRHHEGTMRWCFPADVTGKAGAMWAPIGPCRFSRPIGGGGIIMCRCRVIVFEAVLGIDGRPDGASSNTLRSAAQGSAERAVETAKHRYEARH
jgi:hypothetical protein